MRRLPWMRGLRFSSDPSLITRHLFCYRYERHVYAYGSYPTPSKSRRRLLGRSASTLDWVEEYSQHIKYHARWRVYLYFLLLVAYHNQHRIIQMHSTRLQYGFGSPNLPACHSSLFPRLVDYSMRRDTKNLRRLTSIIDASFLEKWNNMTVTCPEISNRFDTFLEGSGSGSVLRKQLLFILTACSFGKYKPHTALKIFFMHMGVALKEKQRFVEKFDSIDEKRAAKRVISLQAKGMFSLVSPVYHSPDREVIARVLQWKRGSETLASAYTRTRRILLTGDKKAAKAFLKRF